MVLTNDKKTKITLSVMALTIASQAPILDGAIKPLMDIPLSGNFTVGSLLGLLGHLGSLGHYVHIYLYNIPL